MSFSVSSAKAANPAALTPKPVPAGASTVDYNVRQEIYASELLNSELIRVINIPAGSPNLALPSAAQLLTLFQNPVIGSVRTLYMPNDAQVPATASPPASQVVAHNSISLVTIRVQDPDTPVVNVQIFPVGASSVPGPIAFGLTVGAGVTLAANLTKPQLSSNLTEVTLQGATVAAAPVTFDTAPAYFTAFSGSPALPISYSFVINNDSGNSVTLTNSASVTVTFGAPLLANGSVYEVTLHFNAAGTTAKAGIAQIA